MLEEGVYAMRNPSYREGGMVHVYKGVCPMFLFCFWGHKGSSCPGKVQPNLAGAVMCYAMAYMLGRRRRREQEAIDPDWHIEREKWLWVRWGRTG